MWHHDTEDGNRGREVIDDCAALQRRDDPERQTDDDTYDGGHGPQAQAVWKTLYDQPVAGTP